MPLITAGHAVALARKTIGARRIGLVSPYPEGLTKASIGYWQARGFEVDGVVQIATNPATFHPIYSIPAADAQQGLDRLAGKRLDAIVMLGTGMPTLEPILSARRSAAPRDVVHALPRLGVHRRRPRRQAGCGSAADFIRGEGWGPRLRERAVK